MITLRGKVGLDGIPATIPSRLDQRELHPGRQLALSSPAGVGHVPVKLTGSPISQTSLPWRCQGPSLAARARTRNARTEGFKPADRLIRHVKLLGFRNSANDHRRIRFHCTRNHRPATAASRSWPAQN